MTILEAIKELNKKTTKKPLKESVLSLAELRKKLGLEEKLDEKVLSISELRNKLGLEEAIKEDLVVGPDEASLKLLDTLRNFSSDCGSKGLHGNVLPDYDGKKCLGIEIPRNQIKELIELIKTQHGEALATKMEIDEKNPNEVVCYFPEYFVPEEFLKEDVEDDEIIEIIDEDFESSKPVQTLSRDVVINTAKDIRPGTFFRLGVMTESRSVASAYRGGRGSAENPVARVIKCSEMYVATGEQYTSQKEYQKPEEENPERTSRFHPAEDPQLKNKIILSNKDNSEYFVFYKKRGSIPKVKYFLSLNDEDLQEVSKEEVAKYLTPSAAAELTNPREPVDPADAKIPYRNVKIENIYLLKNAGTSLMN